MTGLHKPAGSAGTAKRRRILVVEDDPYVQEALDYCLSDAGFDVRLETSGGRALFQAREWRPDVCLLDVVLPEMNGFEICQRLRGEDDLRHIPVLMLTGKSREADRVAGLETGADDYLVKPFSPRELVLRVQNLLKRAEPPAPAPQKATLTIDELTVVFSRHEVSIRNEPVHLTATEFKLLAALITADGQVVERDVLLRDVWQYSSGAQSRTLDTHVRRLREKLGSAMRFIRTVRSVGYRFDATATDSEEESPLEHETASGPGA